MKMKVAKTVKVKIDELNPAEYNPRRDLQPEDQEYKKLLKSIQKFGYVLYIVINKDKTVIGGHQRLKILKDLGYEELEVTQVDLNKKDEKALNLALNKIDGLWDYDMLGGLIKELNSDGFDMDVTGFSTMEISAFTTDIDTNFSFDTDSPVETEKKSSQESESETPDDMADVEGDSAGSRVVVYVGFETKERATEFLEFIGVDDLDWKADNKRIDGDELDF